MLQLSVHSQMGQEPSSIDHINGHFIFANQATQSPAQVVHWNTEEDLLSVWSGLTQCLWARSYLYFFFKTDSHFSSCSQGKTVSAPPSDPFSALCSALCPRRPDLKDSIQVDCWIQPVDSTGRKSEARREKDQRYSSHHLLGLAWFWGSDSSHQEALLPDSSPIGSR